jgi:hypothetical protein
VEPSKAARVGKIVDASVHSTASKLLELLVTCNHQLPWLQELEVAVEELGGQLLQSSTLSSGAEYRAFTAPSMFGEDVFE